MKIGILSDTHNNGDNTQVALSAFRERGINKLIHCGDITTPGIVYLFMGWDVTFVFGNMDRDHAALVEAAKSAGLRIPQRTQIVDVDGASIAVTHGDHAAELFRLTVSRKHAYVCHGHTHERRNEVRNSYGVRMINPGALGGSKPQTRSIAILETDSGELEFIEFPTL